MMRYSSSPGATRWSSRRTARRRSRESRRSGPRSCSSIWKCRLWTVRDLPPPQGRPEDRAHPGHHVHRPRVDVGQGQGIRRGADDYVSRPSTRGDPGAHRDDPPPQPPLRAAPGGTGVFRRGLERLARREELPEAFQLAMAYGQSGLWFSERRQGRPVLSERWCRGSRRGGIARARMRSTTSPMEKATSATSWARLSPAEHRKSGTSLLMEATRRWTSGT
jgi:hypothetical protein